MNSYFVYILGSKSGVLYIGVTSNIVKRVFEHKEKYVKGFSQKYNVNRLLYFEETSNVTSAIEREKQLKKWKREWKENLINQKIQIEYLT